MSRKKKYYYRVPSFEKFTIKNPISKEVVGFLLSALFLFFLLALLSYSPHDNTLFSYNGSHHGVSNWAGVVGAHMSSLLLYLFGSAVYILLFGLVVQAYVFFERAANKQHQMRFRSVPLLVMISAALCSCYGIDMTQSVPGGLVGQTICSFLYVPLGVGGTTLVLWTFFVVSMMMIVRFSCIAWGAKIVQSAALFLWHLLSVTWFVIHQSMYGAYRAYGVFGSWFVRVKERWSKKDVHVSPATSLPEADFKQEEPAQEIHSDRDDECGYWHELVSKTAVVHQPAVVQHGVKSSWLDDEHRAQKNVFTLAHLREQRRKGVRVCRIPNSVVQRNMFALSDDVEKGYKKFVEELKKSVSLPTKAHLFELPDLSLFIQKKNNDQRERLKEESTVRGKKLEEKLEHFGIKGRIMGVKPGPFITLFEYQPDVTSKISKITALEDDLAMALSAVSIRIIAPIPGKNAIGFEIANPEREDVYFSDVVHANVFKDFRGNLPLVLGVDVVGRPIIEDLSKMPHLLIGGTTGSGKSVGLNAMLVSLLCSKKPHELKLILVDPKRLEFTPYADIPHLLFPIVTNPVKATKVLAWVVQEMEDRYEKMARAGVRNLSEYQKLAASGALDAEGNCYEQMPFIVVMIDELADLMIVAGKEVETHIVRIAQMARASGIHMIVATQRPSVDVVTGLIKVNFPSRISFRVSSKVDSRTIIDERGGEKLLGRGDMLFKNSASPHLERIHGAYISDEEIEQLANHVRAQQACEYLDVHEALEMGVSKSDEEKDELYPHVKTFLNEIDEISISSLQRHFRIGFNRSARIIQQLEMDGLLAPAQGSKPRKVLR